MRSRSKYSDGYREMKNLCKRLIICYSGDIYEAIKNKDDFYYKKYYDSYISVFENSALFESIHYDEMDDDYTAETAYKSKNGLIYIVVSDLDPLSYSGVSIDKNDWETVTAVSDLGSDFIGDIVKAYEEYYKTKIYHSRYKKIYNYRCEKYYEIECLVLSDKEINEEDWKSYIKV